MENDCPMTLSQKIEHIWFYYKWYIVIGLFLLVFVVFCCVQCSSRTEKDLSLLVVTGSSNTEVNDATCNEMRYFIRREYATDRDGDGLASVEFYHYVVGEGEQTTDATTQQAITLSIYGAEEFLILCDEAGYQHLRAMGAGENAADILEPLSGVLADGVVPVDEFRVSLEGTALGELETINEVGEQKLYACLRSYTGSRAEGDKTATERYKEACRVLNAILADKAEVTPSAQPQE